MLFAKWQPFCFSLNVLSFMQNYVKQDQTGIILGTGATNEKRHLSLAEPIPRMIPGQVISCDLFGPKQLTEPMQIVNMTLGKNNKMKFEWRCNFFLFQQNAFRNAVCQIYIFYSGFKQLLPYLTNQVSILEFENFIETKLAKALGRIAEESWCPSTSQLSETWFLQGHSESLDEVAIFFRIHLNIQTQNLHKILYQEPSIFLFLNFRNKTLK